VKIATWNVNSIKVRLAHVLSWLESAQPDALCLQEIKCATDEFPALELKGLGYHAVVSGQKTYNGVALLTKDPPEDVRIGLTHMGSTPLRATASEAALRGQPLNADTIAAAAVQAADGTEPPADLNASADYKRHLARVLTRRALEAASQ